MKIIMVLVAGIAIKTTLPIPKLYKEKDHQYTDQVSFRISVETLKLFFLSFSFVMLESAFKLKKKQAIVFCHSPRKVNKKKTVGGGRKKEKGKKY